MLARPGIVWLGVVALAAAVTWLSTAPALSAGENQVTLEGVISVQWEDGPPGSGYRRGPILILTDNLRRRYELEIPDAVAEGLGVRVALSGRRVRVSGTLLVVKHYPGTKLLADQVELLDEGKANLPILVTGNQPWVSILCKFPELPDEPHALSYYQEMYANTYPGLDHFWRELSYDIIDVEGSDAFGWYTMPDPVEEYSGDGWLDRDRLMNDCAAAADADVLFTDYVGLSFFFNSNFVPGEARGGQWSSTLDGVSQEWRFAFLPLWVSSGRIGTVAHEMGHGFGMSHSSGLYGLVYDNAWDVMSNSHLCNPEHEVYGCVGQHAIADHKRDVSWISDGQVVEVEGVGTVTVSLERLAQPQGSGPLMVDVMRGYVHHHTIEFRQRVGYDAQLPGDGIIIHRSGGTEGLGVVDIDNNGDTGDEGAIWSPGERYVDLERGLGVKVESIDASTAEVLVDYFGDVPARAEWLLAEGAEFQVLPAAASISGAEGTSWLSDLVLSNPGGVDAAAHLYLLEEGTSNLAAEPETVTVLGYESLLVEDLVGELFGRSETAGAVLIATGEPLLIMSRTFNDAADGTYGQSIPGLAATEASSGTDPQRLIQLTSNQDFRSNIGFVNLTDQILELTVDFYAADGSLLGTTTPDAEPLGYRQDTDPIAGLAKASVDDAYAVVRADDENARYLAWASTVDNTSGDPVFMRPPQEARPCCEGWSRIEVNPAYQIYAVAFGNGRYVAVGAQGFVAVSDDGSQWQEGDTGCDDELSEIAWGNGLFVALGWQDLGEGERDVSILTSPDGEVWSRTEPAGADFRRLYGVVWDGAQFVAVDNSGAVLTSPDGGAWTTQETDMEWVRGIAWNGSRYVALGNVMYLSDDAATWTETALPTETGLWEIAWTGERFVATGDNLTIVTSEDGEDWTLRHSSAVDDRLWAVAASASHVLAVGDGGTVFGSADGSEWWPAYPGVSDDIYDVVWEGAQPVAVTRWGAVLLAEGCGVKRIWLPGAAHSEGAEGTVWRTDLEVHNPGADDLSFAIDLLPWGSSTATSSPSYTLGPGESRRFRDVVDGVFGHSGAATLRFELGAGDAQVSARTFNDATDRTYGQHIPGHTVLDLGTWFDDHMLTGLRGTAAGPGGFRTNIGFVNVSSFAVDVGLSVYAADGDWLFDEDVALDPYESIQLHDVFSNVSVSVDTAYAWVWTETQGGRYLVYASVIDNLSGDPVYIPGQVVE